MRLSDLPGHLTGCVIGELTNAGCDAEDILWLSAPSNAMAFLTWIADEEKRGSSSRERLPDLKGGVLRVPRAETLPFARLNNLIQALSNAGVTETFVGWLKHENNARRALCWIRICRGFFQENPYQQSVQEQINAVLRLNEFLPKGSVGKLSAQMIDQLGDETPEWPPGGNSHRSLEWRLGGAFATFDMHFSHAQRVLEGILDIRGARLPKPPQRLDLLRVVSGEHRPGIRWVVFDADLGRQRKDVRDVQQSTSLSDAGLALLWLNPQYAHSIGKESPGMLLPGYRVPTFDPSDTYEHHLVPGVVRNRFDGKLYLDFFAETDVNPDLAAPWTRY